MAAIWGPVKMYSVRNRIHPLIFETWINEAVNLFLCYLTRRIFVKLIVGYYQLKS